MMLGSLSMSAAARRGGTAAITFHRRALRCRQHQQHRRQQSGVQISPCRPRMIFASLAAGFRPLATTSSTRQNQPRGQEDSSSPQSGTHTPTSAHGDSCNENTIHTTTVKASATSTGSSHPAGHRDGTDGSGLYEPQPPTSSKSRPSHSLATQNAKQETRTKNSGAVSSSPLPHENIYTLPNILTFSRLLLTPAIGYLVVEGSHPGLALSLFCYAGATDLVDGWIARRWKLQTVVGSVIDPMADKALMTVLTAALAANGSLPVWLAVIILGRDAGLGISAIYYRWISLPPPKTFMRYWDFSLPSAEVRPTTISKYNTFLQLGLVGLTTAQPIFEPWTGLDMGGFLGVLHYIVAVTTVWSGASYIFSKDAVRILTQKSKKKQ